MRQIGGVLALAVLMLGAVSAMQKTTAMHPGTGGSPHVRTEWTIDGANISIEYGRPYIKGRPLGTLVPNGQVWRAGADEATTLKTDKALVFGNLTVPAGTHTLFIHAQPDKWQLAVNKQTGQWGTDYNAKNDLGRVDMNLETAAKPVEQHTISIDPQPGGGVLRIEWGPARATVPFKVQK